MERGNGYTWIVSKKQELADEEHLGAMFGTLSLPSFSFSLAKYREAYGEC